MGNDPKKDGFGCSAILCRMTHIVERLVDGELVLYDPERQCLHALNSSAALVWLQCDGKNDQSSIVASLAGRYPDSKNQIDGDVSEVLMLFKDQGLLKP